MEIACAILAPIFIFTFVMAWLFLLKEGFLFYRSLRLGQLDISEKRIWWIGASIAYIITALVCGLLTL